MTTCIGKNVKLVILRNVNKYIEMYQVQELVDSIDGVILNCGLAAEYIRKARAKHNDDREGYIGVYTSISNDRLMFELLKQTNWELIEIYEDVTNFDK